MNSTVQLLSKKWGNNFFRFEKMEIGPNKYYGVKILGLKIMVWHHLFD